MSTSRYARHCLSAQVLLEQIESLKQTIDRQGEMLNALISAMSIKGENGLPPEHAKTKKEKKEKKQEKHREVVDEQQFAIDDSDDDDSNDQRDKS
jgi:BRCT domain type II-containing protein